ncbi:Putative uncharacterized protein [Staphylococcus xylosus]|uniref:hypothetical protein n=1 Tax=Staphylococcus xylosus TaxID=1288 RepID=UPI0004F5CBD5|nr:hypothetical protein [Staphylococcus xylosus]CEF18823.1 Putative uncharacterized protein [Staphylococcus xylosus]
MHTNKVTNKRMSMALGRILTTAFAQHIKQCKQDNSLSKELHNELSEVQARLYSLINQNKIEVCIKTIPNFLIPYLDTSIKDVEQSIESYIKPSFYEIDNKLKVLI